MSLRFRLILLVVSMMTIVVLVLSGLYLNSLVNSLSASALERSELASQQVNASITENINNRSREYEAPASLDQMKSLWRQIVSTDPDIASMLERTMALSPALVEINVGGEEGTILASSNPSRVGQKLDRLQNFADWRNRSLYRRLVDLIARRRDYQVVVPLGIAGQSDPIFTIQVVTSTVLLRDAALPQIETVSLVAAAALIISVLLTGLATSRALRPIRRIEQTIDRITQGNFRAEEAHKFAPRVTPRELVAVENKLTLLGEQFSGARQDATNLKASLDEMVERMASQLDVAARLAAISRLSGSVAHEIKNPLNAISLRLDLLRARAEMSDEALIPEIDVLSKEVRRLDRVVKTFLDFSRPVEIRLADLDLNDLAGEVTTLMTPQARLAGIEVKFEPAHQPALIRGDADMLKQAVLNLFTNAIEALKNGGRLVVAVKNDGDSVVLEVADNGPGIPPEVRDKVFQLYFTTKEKGSGIGLAMTYRAVQLHNGTVEFESEVGKGTTFRLQFPALVPHV
jgi:signal transduction histidine kinase